MVTQTATSPYAKVSRTYRAAYVTFNDETNEIECLPDPSSILRWWSQESRGILAFALISFLCPEKPTCVTNLYQTRLIFSSTSEIYEGYNLWTKPL